jgi:hypothetical protein
LVVWLVREMAATWAVRKGNWTVGATAAQSVGV